MWLLCLLSLLCRQWLVNVYVAIMVKLVPESAHLHDGRIENVEKTWRKRGEMVYVPLVPSVPAVPAVHAVPVGAAVAASCLPDCGCRGCCGGETIA